MDCIFCKIISAEIPSHKVYEDENVLVFLDISPVNYGHTLVIPKIHVKNLEEISEEALCYTSKVIKKIGQAVKKGLEVEGYNVCLNNDPVAGQIVPHLHWHIIPRNSSDGLEPWLQGKYADGEAEEAAEKIKAEL